MEEMKIIDVMIVEDDDEIREELSFALNKSSVCRCTGAFSSGEAIMEEVSLHMPDIILMDIGLPGMNGIECLKQVKNLNPEISVIMLTVFEDDERVFESIASGAEGYLLKKTPTPKIIESLLDLRSGGAPMSAPIARRVLDIFRAPGMMKTDNLTKREVEILDQLVKGYTPKQIADKLFISTGTVRDHLKNIYQKLHVHSKTEVVAKVLSFHRFPFSK